MSYVFDMFFLFWLVVICLFGILSNLDEIGVRLELLADGVWEADDDKPSFLSVRVDSFDQLYLYKRPMSFSMAENGNKNRKYDKWE